MALIMQRYALAASALALGLQGCALSKSEPASLNIRAAPTATSQLSARDGLYASAASAINRGDYGYALDLLQAARDRGGEDARILNAFGVVYDKLGRFDLSQRYYAAARALDPTSQIVAQNLAYSQILQGKSAPIALAAAATTAAPLPAPSSSPTPDAPAPAVIAPLATAALAEPQQVARTELRQAAVGGALRPTPTLNAPPEAAAPVERPAAAAAVVADATPWDAPVILAPASAPRTAPPRAVGTPKLAAVAVAPATPKSQARRTAPAAPARTVANGAPAHRSPQRLAANTPAPRALAGQTASIARPVVRAAARPAPAPRGWTLAAAHDQVARVLARGLRFFEDLERCRTGCSQVTLPLNAKPTLRVTDKAPGGPPYLS